MSTEKKVAEEVAELEFNRFAESMDLDLDPQFMDEEERAGFSTQKRRIIKEITRGNLVINENGEAVYTPWKSKYQEPITFREQTGASILAIDNKGTGKDVAKTFAMMGEICGIPSKVFSGLVGTDIKVCMALFALLMD